MSKLAVYNTKGKEVGSVTLDSDFVKGRVNTRLLYYTVNNYLASKHKGTHKSKGRSEVSGGGKKPWRQKGTGRARFGSIRNPLWRGGGTAFGPVVRSYAYSMPRKAKKIALLEAIKSKLKTDNFIVFEGLSLDKPKTKDMVGVLTSLGIDSSALIVTAHSTPNVVRSAANLTDVKVVPSALINVLDLVSHEMLVATVPAIRNIEGIWGESLSGALSPLSPWHPHQCAGPAVR